MKKYYIYIILFITLITKTLHADNLQLDAEEIIFKKDNNIIAEGNVNASYLTHKLNAGFLEYNKKLGNIVAKDNVRYNSEENKLRFLATEINSNIDFTIINADNIRARLAEDSYLRAQKLYRNQDKYEISKGNYTSCKLCKDGKVKIPQWEVYASKILYDETKQNIYFTNAFLKIYKIPVLYLPKLILPGPQVKKRTGLLPIRYSSDSLLHNQISVPVFINLSSNYDITYTPTIYSKNNIYHEAEIRYLNKSGIAKMSGGYVKENGEFKDYLQANGIDILNEDQQKWYLDLQYVFNSDALSFEGNIFDSSDRAILERYSQNFQQYYHSDINLNHVSDKKSFLFNVGKSYDFINNNKTYELPHISYKNIKTLKNDIFYKYQLDYVSLNSPENNVHRQRFLYKDSFYKKFISRNGLLFKAQLDNVFRSYYNDNSNVNDDFNSHYTAKLGFNIEKPYLRKGKKVHYMVTPKASLIIAPNNTNSNQISNLDSGITYLNYTNLLSADKNSGNDLMEQGTRFNYGIMEGMYTDNIIMESFFGQAYYIKRQDHISRISGIKREFSDYVGNFKFSFKDHINLDYNYKMEETNLAPYHNQASLNINFGKLSYNADYTKYKYNVLDKSSTPLNQISTSITYKSPDRFKITASTVRNLLAESMDPKAGSVTSKMNIELYGHCVTYLIDFQKDYITTDYVKPDLKIMFGFRIKGF